MDETEALLRLAETLLPGGAGFPAFSATGAGLLLPGRLPDGVPARLLAAVTRGATPPDSPAAWTDAASRLDAVEPEMFTELRRQAFLAYYEQPAVTAAIRSLGHPYNDAPLPAGYPTAPFDPARDTPRHARGRWIDTADVQPVDVAGLGLEPLR